MGGGGGGVENPPVIKQIWTEGRAVRWAASGTVSLWAEDIVSLSPASIRPGSPPHPHHPHPHLPDHAEPSKGHMQSDWLSAKETDQNARQQAARGGVEGGAGGRYKLQCTRETRWRRPTPPPHPT